MWSFWCCKQFVLLLCNTLKPVCDGISRQINIFPLQTYFHLTQNSLRSIEPHLRKMAGSVSTVTGLRAGGSVNGFWILGEAGFCVFYHLNSDWGALCDAFQQLWQFTLFGMLKATRNLSVCYVLDNRDFDFRERREFFRKFKASGLCRPVVTGAWLRWLLTVKLKAVLYFETSNCLPVPQIFVFRVRTPCRIVSVIQHLNVR